MHADRPRVRYAPTAIGALMDPDFLRRAANDACAITNANVPEPSRWRDILHAWRAEAALLSAHLRERHRAWHP